MREGWIRFLEELCQVYHLDEALVGMGEVVVLPSPRFIYQYCRASCIYKAKNYCNLFDGHVPVDTCEGVYQYFHQRRECCVQLFGGMTYRKQRKNRLIGR